MKHEDMKKYIAEALGTFFILFFGCCTIIYSQQIYFITGIVYGVLVAITYVLFSRYSGAHMNPAITVAMLVKGKISTKDLLYYIIAQLIGAVAGVGLCKILGGAINSSANFSNVYGVNSALTAGVGVALVVETLLSFIFVLVFLAASDRFKEGAAGAVIGTAFGAASIIAIPFTQGGLNPAKSLAAAIFEGMTAIEQVWVFILAPVVGAIGAVFVYGYFNDPSSADLQADKASEVNTDED